MTKKKMHPMVPSNAGPRGRELDPIERVVR